LEGEKIDILKFDPDPRVLIKNALSPAEVTNVVILDEARRQALAIVPEDQLSLAIGKQGLNVRLANRLADWNIDVKTMDQFDELDIAAESKRAVSALFRDHDEEPEDEITSISELPGITDEMVRILEANNITMIEEIVGLSDDDLRNLDGMNPDIVTDLSNIIAENVEIVEEEDYDYDEVEDEVDEDEYDEEEAPEVETADTQAYSAGDDTEEPEDTTDDDAREDDEPEQDEEVITEIEQLPSMTEAIVAKLNAAGVADLEDLINLDPDNLQEVEGLTEDEAATIRTILTEYVEIVEGDEE
jgi:N utilization substance protein A